jgi:G:T-mismatch repair DNA endonuclease (very short patch repair protein)
MAKSGCKAERVTCKCGRDVSCNTFKFHLKTACNLAVQEKDFLIEFLSFYQENKRGWKKADGENATYDEKWWKSVYDGESSVDDWVFSPPRKLGAVTPNAAKRFSEDRKGADNPMAKKALLEPYTKEECEIFLSQLCEEAKHEDSPLTIKEVEKTMKLKYPMWGYLLCDGVPSLAYIKTQIGLSEEEFQKHLSKKRGKLIQKGQLASEKHKRTASRCASELVSKWRVTEPQRILFAMVKSIDDEATLEFRMKGNDRTVSFDIFSKKANACIEMHGRIWHDISAAPEKLKETVTKNTKNDIRKQEIAQTAGYKYIVFWDDQQELWENQVESIFSQRPCSLQEAKDKVSEIARNQAGI